MDELNLGTTPLADIVAWGNPWHGPIVGTTLTLPDASTRTLAAAPENSAVFEFRVPGAPGGGGAPVPAGGEWRDYLLLYGNCRHVYGEEISGLNVNWLYARADGSRWMVRLTGAITGIALNNDPITVFMQAQRFGEFGGTPENILFSATLASRGLGDTLPSAFASQLPASVNIGISHITPDGKKCCFVFYADAPDTQYVGGQRLPYGFFEVVLHDTVFSGSTATLLYSVADVLGTRVERVEVNDPGVDLGCGLVGTHTHVTPSSATDCIVAVWYDGTGNVQQVTIDMEDFSEDRVGTLGDLEPPFGCPPWSYTELLYSHHRISMRFAGIDVAVIDNNYEAEITGTANRKPTPDVESGTYTETETLNGVVVFSETGSRGPVFPLLDGVWWLERTYGHGLFHPWAHNTTFIPITKHVYFMRLLSPTLIAVCRHWEDGGLNTEIIKYITPSGLLDNPDFTLAVDTEWRDISGAWQPVTNQINIGADGQVRAWV